MSSSATAATETLTEEEMEALFNEGEAPAEDPDEREDPAPEAANDETVDKTEVDADKDAPTEADDTQVDTDWEREFRSAQQTIAQLQQNVRSNSGRVSAYQQKINQLELQLKQAQASPHAESSEVPQQDAEKVARQVVDLLMSGDEEKAATALAQALTRGAAGTGVNDRHVKSIVDEAIRPFQEAEKTRYVKSQEQALESIHPDWRETAQSDAFKTWVEQQPHSVQMLATSEDAADASTLLTYYKQAQALAQSSQAPAPNETVAHIQAKRERQLNQGQSPSTRSGRSVGGGTPEDPDALFDYLERHDPDYGRR